MRVSTIALANLKRRKSRAVFLAVGIGIGIATAVSLFTLSRIISQEIGQQMDQYGANIVVVPKSNNLSLEYGGITVEGVPFDVARLKDEDVGRIRKIPYSSRLSVVAPKILGAVSAEGRQVLMAGVDFEQELKLKRWWRLVGQKPEGPADLLVGYEAAKALGLIEPSPEDLSTTVLPSYVSDEVQAGGLHQHNAAPQHFRIIRDRLKVGGREYRVASVITPTGGREDEMIYGQLAEVQSLLGKPGELSMIEVSALCQGCPVSDIVAQISQQLPAAKVSALQQAVRARAETVERLSRFALAVSAVVLVIGALMIFTTMTGAVIERTKEIGVLRAVGFRRSHIIRGLMLEVSIVSVAGGVAGWTAGLLAGRLLLPYFSMTDASMKIDPLVGVVAILSSLLIGALSSIYPTLRASRLDPSEAVRYV